MTAPSYATDLETINLAENTGTWDELDDWNGGGTVYILTKPTFIFKEIIVALKYVPKLQLKL